MPDDEIIEPERLADVMPTIRCPECHSPNIQRGSDQASVLWTLQERCMMCEWSRVIPNVEVAY